MEGRGAATPASTPTHPPSASDVYSPDGNNSQLKDWAFWASLTGGISSTSRCLPRHTCYSHHLVSGTKRDEEHRPEI